MKKKLSLHLLIIPVIYYIIIVLVYFSLVSFLKLGVRLRGDYVHNKGNKNVFNIHVLQYLSIEKISLYNKFFKGKNFSLKKTLSLIKNKPN